jgi:Arc/MetJ-type ribon-helix-helix transcriptional regulator
LGRHDRRLLVPKQLKGMKNTVVRLSESLRSKVEEAARRSGYGSASALIRAALEERVSERAATLTDTERRIAESLDRLGRQLRRLGNAQQAQFALTDALARLFLICVPEPPKDVFELAKARPKERYDKLLRGVAENMAGEARTTLTGLVEPDE